MYFLIKNWNSSLFMLCVYIYILLNMLYWTHACSIESNLIKLFKWKIDIKWHVLYNKQLVYICSIDYSLYTNNVHTPTCIVKQTWWNICASNLKVPVQPMFKFDQKIVLYFPCYQRPARSQRRVVDQTITVQYSRRVAVVPVLIN